MGVREAVGEGDEVAEATTDSELRRIGGCCRRDQVCDEGGGPGFGSRIRDGDGEVVGVVGSEGSGGSGGGEDGVVVRRGIDEGGGGGGGDGGVVGGLVVVGEGEGI